MFEVSLGKGYGVKLQPLTSLHCLGHFITGFEKTKSSFECTAPTLKRGFSKTRQEKRCTYRYHLRRALPLEASPISLLFLTFVFPNYPPEQSALKWNSLQRREMPRLELFIHSACGKWTFSLFSFLTLTHNEMFPTLTLTLRA